MGMWLKRVWGFLGEHELATLLLIALSTGGVWVFVELATEVRHRSTNEFDEAVLLAMRDAADPSEPLGPPWFQEVMRDCTAFGGVAWLTLLTLAVIGYLAFQRQTGAMWLVVAAVLGGWALSTATKSFFDRPRPDLVPHGSHVYSASFPSGHSMMAAVTYLTLAALLIRVQSQRRMKAYLLVLAIVLTGLTGVSRVYLGVHWPTDVLAGWSLGTTWAIVCWLVARWLQRRGHIEPPES